MDVVRKYSFKSLVITGNRIGAVVARVHQKKAEVMEVEELNIDLSLELLDTFRQ